MRYLVIGNLNIDIQVWYDGTDTPYSHQSIGGKGLNIAKNLRFFAQDVSLSTTLGKDVLGRDIENFLQENNISLTPNSFCSDKSMVYFEYLDSKYNTLYRNYSTELFQFETVPDVSWKEIGVCVVMSSSQEFIFQELYEVKKRFPHIAFVLEFAGKRDHKKITPFLSTFDMIIGNEKEMKSYAEEMELNYDTLPNILYSAHSIECVVETLGERGARMAVNGELHRYSTSPLPVEKIVSTIGAGDSLTSAMIVSRYTNKCSWKESLEIGMETAKKVLQTEKAYLE